MAKQSEFVVFLVLLTLILPISALGAPELNQVPPSAGTSLRIAMQKDRALAPRFKGNKDLTDQQAKAKIIINLQELKHLRVRGPGTSGGTAKFNPSIVPEPNGGGNIMICGSLSKTRFYLADTFPFFQQHLQTLNDENMDQGNFDDGLFQDFWNKAIRAHFNRKQPGLGDAILKRMYELRFVFLTRNEIPGLFDENLPLLNDDHIPKDFNCKKQQLAVQDLESGLVAVDFELFSDLSRVERILFRLHEALISLQKTQEDTTAIRSEVADFLNNEGVENLFPAIVADKYIENPPAVRAIYQLNMFLASNNPQEINSYIQAANSLIDTADKSGQMSFDQILRLTDELNQYQLKVIQSMQLMLRLNTP